MMPSDASYTGSETTHEFWAPEHSTIEQDRARIAPCRSHASRIQAVPAATCSRPPGQSDVRLAKPRRCGRKSAIVMLPTSTKKRNALMDISHQHLRLMLISTSTSRKSARDSSPKPETPSLPYDHLDLGGEWKNESKKFGKMNNFLNYFKFRYCKYT